METSSLSTADIVSRTGLNKSVVQRQINTFVDSRYLVRDATTRRYHLGIDFIALGASARRSIHMRTLALPFMADIARSTGAVINLNALDRSRWLAVCIESVDGAEKVRYSMNLGGRGYLHAGGTRKSILAFLSEDERAQVIETHGLPALTQRTCTSIDDLVPQLQEIRRQRYAVTRGESDGHAASGVGCGVPVFAGGGRILGSIGAIGPASRMSTEVVREVIDKLLEAGIAISEGLANASSG